MTRIRHLNQHCVDHGQIERRRHAVIQETRIDHITVVVVDELLVQGPTDTLNRTALDLAFHIARMNRRAHILSRRIAQDLHLARIRIDFHIHHMGGKRTAHAAWLHRRTPGQGTARAGQRSRDLFKGHVLLRILLIDERAARIVDIIRRHHGFFRRPAPGTAFFHLRNHIQRRIVSRVAGSKRRTAPTRHVGVANAIRIHHVRLHILIRELQCLSRLHGDRRTRAADVRRPFDQVDRPIGIDIDHHRGLKTDVEPEPRRHATAAVRTGQRCGIVLVFQRRMHRLHVADARERHARHLPFAFLGAIDSPQLQGVHIEKRGGNDFAQ